MIRATAKCKNDGTPHRVALFSIQSRGTGSVGKLFGPITVVWLLVIAALGVRSIIDAPQVLAAVDPRHAIAFATTSPGLAFLALGAVFLALTAPPLTVTSHKFN